LQDEFCIQCTPEIDGNDNFHDYDYSTEFTSEYVSEKRLIVGSQLGKVSFLRLSVEYAACG